MFCFYDPSEMSFPIAKQPTNQRGRNMNKTNINPSPRRNLLIQNFCLFCKTFRNGHCIEVFVEQVDHHHEVQTMIIIIHQRPQIRWVVFTREKKTLTKFHIFLSFSFGFLLVFVFTQHQSHHFRSIIFYILTSQSLFWFPFSFSFLSINSTHYSTPCNISARFFSVQYIFWLNFLIYKCVTLRPSFRRNRSAWLSIKHRSGASLRFHQC